MADYAYVWPNLLIMDAHVAVLLFLYDVGAFYLWVCDAKYVRSCHFIFVVFVMGVSKVLYFFRDYICY